MWPEVSGQNGNPDQHARVALRTATEGLVRRRIARRPGLRRISGRVCGGEQTPAKFQFLSAEAVGEEAEVADALKAGRQGVDQKAADELVGGQSHDAGFLAPFCAVVLPAECNFTVTDVEDAVVGKSDSVRVAAEILKNALGTSERLLRIDDPFHLAQRLQIFGESGAVFKRRDLTEELKLPLSEGIAQSSEKEAAEEF